MKIYRLNTEIIDVEIDDKSVYKYTIMGDEVCELNFTSESFIDFLIGDYLTYEGQIFTINTPIKRIKIANNEYTYNLRFEGIKYELGKTLFKLDGKIDYPLSSDIEQILDLVIINLNENSSIVWEKGTSSITPFYDFDIANENCLQILTRACIEFEVEFEVVPSAEKYVINVRDLIGIYDGIQLYYKRGIFQITVEPISQENIITRLYAFGAAKNIPASYGNDRIKIAPIENNVSEYGIYEGIIVYEDIYPTFEGSVDSAAGNDFVDANIDFDVNSQLIPGMQSKIVFKSGNLAGYEFTVVGFNNSTKTVTLANLLDDIGRNLPTDEPIVSGDRYTFVDIYMPASYLSAAESELLSRANAYLAKYSEPLTKYSITIDSRYLRDREIQLYAGQKIKVLDLDMNISVELRIYSITQSLADPYQYTIELTDNLQTSRMIKLVYGQFDTDKVLENYRKEIRILKHN